MILADFERPNVGDPEYLAFTYINLYVDFILMDDLMGEGNK